MPVEPPVKRAIAFFDGQNLFHAVRAAFGYTSPIDQVRFYTGVPGPGFIFPRTPAVAVRNGCR